MAGPICPACGAALASDRRRCPRCGSERAAAAPRGRAWRGPLLAAVVVLLLCAAGFALAYSRLSSQADREASAAAQPERTGQ